ncbi:MAG: DUF2934 domain-containing protein [Spirochaetes bacterium]|nr:DUF2934 domain-containing protein [Spirochaetota bacterium]
MLSKKTTSQQSTNKTGIPRTSRKKKAESSFDLPSFQDEIRLHAYYNYLARMKNNFPGDEMGDWLDAEKNLSRKAITH